MITVRGLSNRSLDKCARLLGISQSQIEQKQMDCAQQVEMYFPSQQTLFNAFFTSLIS